VMAPTSLCISLSCFPCLSPTTRCSKAALVRPFAMTLLYNVSVRCAIVRPMFG
jgi:hypothetical protein